MATDGAAHVWWRSHAILHGEARGLLLRRPSGDGASRPHNEHVARARESMRAVALVGGQLPILAVSKLKDKVRPCTSRDYKLDDGAPSWRQSTMDGATPGATAKHARLPVCVTVKEILHAVTKLWLVDGAERRMGAMLLDAATRLRASHAGAYEAGGSIVGLPTRLPRRQHNCPLLASCELILLVLRLALRQ
jgi:hypothetical protein